LVSDAGKIGFALRLTAVLAMLGWASPSTTGQWFHPLDPDTWRLNAFIPRDSLAREIFVGELSAPGPEGEPGLSREEVEAVLADPRAELLYGRRVVEVMAPTMVARHTREHHALLRKLLHPKIVQRAREFAQRHRAALQSAEARYRVAPEAVIGILMFETRLGTLTGGYRVFNALASQAVLNEIATDLVLSRPQEARAAAADPARQAARVKRIRDRALKNLAALLRHCKAQQTDPFSIKGSWAGAFGFPQFMPASLRLSADGDGDGKVDLFDFEDAIHSVARYLADAGYAKDPSRAVFAYNHDSGYVRGVLTFARRVAQKPPPQVAARKAEAPPRPPRAQARRGDKALR
jgi:membrane-bound lytic murein transglycosylase B